MRLRIILVLSLFLLLSTFSCTKYKDVPYVQDLKRDPEIAEKIANFAPLTVQPGDLLAIQVTSLNREADALINYNLERPTSGAVSMGRPEENSVYGFLVNTQGNINLAYIGSTKVAGYTTEQLSTLLRDKLSEYLKNPVVTVRLQNFRVSVLGDVKNPGTYYTLNEKFTLFEAIAAAGDLNSTGLRKKVLLMRDFGGERRYVNLDLTSKDIITSPYYYMRSGDVLYIQPGREKVQASDSAFQKASILISALSLVAIFVTRYN